MTSNTSACVPIIASEGNFDLDRVELNTKISKISKCDKTQKFTLTLSDESQIDADFVICTVPISMYQKRKIEIDFMPKRRLELFNSISYVHFANCWVLLDEKDEESLKPYMFHYLPTRYRGFRYNVQAMLTHSSLHTAYYKKGSSNKKLKDSRMITLDWL